MDYSVMEVSQEADNWGACFAAAEKAGLTQAQAKDCEEGHRKCPLCPWANEKEG